MAEQVCNNCNATGLVDGQLCPVCNGTPSRAHKESESAPVVAEKPAVVKVKVHKTK